MLEIKLSICIATYKRGNYIGQTLDSIVSQLRDGVEVIILDGASPDNTEEVVGVYADIYPAIRYIKANKNSGIDADYDLAIGYAQGEYCWLMTDDDLFSPDAVSTVFESLDEKKDLIVINAEIRDVTLTKILISKNIDIKEDCEFEKVFDSQFVSKALNHLSFIGAVIIKKAKWLDRDKTSYYGTLFIHIGVIFQNPALEKIKIIAKPLVKIRYGNAMWTVRSFDIWMFMWPKLIWSLPLMNVSNLEKICPRNPHLNLKKILEFRALGAYGVNEYSKNYKNLEPGFKKMVIWIVTIIPIGFINALASVYCLLLNRRAKLAIYDFARIKHSNFLSKTISKIINECF